MAEAVAGGLPVVALESTLISHGLPRPRNLSVAHEVEASVREAGAVPATIAVVAGEARIGLDEAALEAIAGEGVAKCGVRDLQVPGPRQPVADQRALERHDRQAASDCLGHLGSDPHRRVSVQPLT